MHGYVCDCKRDDGNLLIPKRMGKGREEKLFALSYKYFCIHQRICPVMSRLAS